MRYYEEDLTRRMDEKNEEVRAICDRLKKSLTELDFLRVEEADLMFAKKMLLREAA
jgi:hypothetical protein